MAKNLAKELRKKRGGLSLRKAQAVSGIHYATLSRMERGIGASWPNIAAAFAWIGVPATEWHSYMEQRRK